MLPAFTPETSPHTAPPPVASGSADARIHPPGLLFFLLLSLVLVAACASYAALVLHSAPWSIASKLDEIFPFYKWRNQPFSASALARAWQLLAGSGAFFGTAALALTLSPAAHSECAAWFQEMRAAGASLLRPLTILETRQNWIAASIFGALTALRFWLSLTSVTAEYDDAASYTLFVSKGLFTVASYYPLPNNHVLSNVLSWLFYQAHPGFWWTMRLPVVLTATATTALLFAGLLRERLAFRPALLAMLLFSVAQLSLYHSSVGRGYWLLTGMAGVSFFSTLALRAGTTRPRAAWTGLVVSGILGAYTVPTFALVLASSFSWLGVNYLQQKAIPNLLRLVAAGLLVVMGTLLLYAPLMFVSGPATLFGNGFVTSLPFSHFARGLPLYLWQTEGFLAGQIATGAVLIIVGLAGAVLLMRKAATGQMPTGMAAAWRGLAPAALWYMAFPYAVILFQRVFAPGRTLLYKAFFFFLLLAMVVEWLLQFPPSWVRRTLRPALWTMAILWCSYQFASLWRDNRRPSQNNAEYHAAFAWLASQPRGPVLVPEPTHSIFLRMYFLSERPHQPWQLDGRPRPGIGYTYVVAFPNKRGYFQPLFAFPPAYHNSEVDIFRLPPGRTPPAGLPPYWHLNE